MRRSPMMPHHRADHSRGAPLVGGLAIMSVPATPSPCALAPFRKLAVDGHTLRPMTYPAIYFLEEAGHTRRPAATMFWTRLTAVAGEIIGRLEAPGALVQSPSASWVGRWPACPGYRLHRKSRIMVNLAAFSGAEDRAVQEAGQEFGAAPGTPGSTGFLGNESLSGLRATPPRRGIASGLSSGAMTPRTCSGSIKHPPPTLRSGGRPVVAWNTPTGARKDRRRTLDHRS
jgi:hypothetical protein